MRPRGRDFDALTAAARRLASDSARGYLADAFGCLRDTGDPMAALELLCAMWGTGYAKRGQQEGALADVGQWLGERLQREPAISVERLAWELGWLRRMCTYLRAEDERSSEGGKRGPERRNERGGLGGRGNHGYGGRPGHTRAHSRPGERAQTLSDAPFARYLQALQRRRQIQISAGRRHTVIQTPSPPAAPTTLPAELQVQLADLADARARWNRLREREKKGKPGKDALILVVPVAEEYRALAGGICCSLMHTEGMGELFARIAARGGRDRPFRVVVAELDIRDGKRVASRILPADD
jgi:hypothetical protein